MGVEITPLEPGDGRTFPKRGDRVIFHYIGKLNSTTGTEFDNSYTDHVRPFETEIGTAKVIRGWDEGIMQLSKGQKALLTIPPDLAYGSAGYPPVIPSHATLIFEIWLLDVIPRRRQPSGI